MIHSHTELAFISNEVGYGVVAKEFIPAGTITWVLDKLDREFSPFEIQSMDSIYQEILDIIYLYPLASRKAATSDICRISRIACFLSWAWL